MTTFTKISSESKDVKVKNTKIQKLRDLKLGVDELRKQSLIGGKNSKYIPQKSSETDEDFQHRVKYLTDLLNGTKKAIDNIVSRTFQKKAVLDTDSEKLTAIESNFNGKGISMSNFLKNYMNEGLWFGKSYVLVDNNIGTNTPYSVLIKDSQVLDVRYDKEMNITLFRYMQKEKVFINDFEEVEQEVVRVYKYNDTKTSIICEIYTDIDNETVDKQVIDMFIDEMPIVEYYPETTSFGVFVDFPFLDLADKNIVHFRSTADQRNILHYNRIPFISMTGFSEQEAVLKLSATHAMHSANPDSQVGWVEAEGKGIELGAKDLEKLEKEMEAMGAEMLVETSAKTATEAIIESTDVKSRGSAMAYNLQDAANEILRLMKKYIYLENDDSYINVNTNVKIALNDVEFTIILKMKELGIISSETVRQQAYERGLLGDNWNEEEEAERLDGEGMFNLDITQTMLTDDDEDENE